MSTISRLPFARIVLAFCGVATLLLGACGSGAAPATTLAEAPVDRTAIGDPNAPLQVVHWGNFL